VEAMPDWEADNESEHDGSVVTETHKEVKKPPLYKVLLHNDDYTTMEFVVYILQNVFHKAEVDAVRIMLAVHQQGVGVAGVYTHEIAEAKVNKVTQLARTNEFPLLCTLEEE
jgi:ATP-dependent Clp protease adaptor protein ClpS